MVAVRPENKSIRAHVQKDEGHITLGSGGESMAGVSKCVVIIESYINFAITGVGPRMLRSALWLLL